MERPFSTELQKRRYASGGRLAIGVQILVNGGMEVLDTLNTAPPAVPMAAAIGILAREYGMAARGLTPLTSERDTNFKVETDKGLFVLKFANAGERPDVTRLQTAALLHLQAQAPNLPVPRVLPTLSGTMETEWNGSMVRVLSWLEGLPLHMAPHSTMQRQSIARGAAGMGKALSNFHFPGGEQDLQWDIQHALRLRADLHAVEPDGRPLVVEALERFETHAAPLMPKLRRQFVHGDLNPYNLLVNPQNPDEVTGILDFGDMVKTPLVTDLAIAAGYHAAKGDDVMQSLAEFIAAYHEILPLEAREIGILPELIMARFVTTLVITSWRAKAYPENSVYILRNAPAAWAGLRQVLSVPRDEAVSHFMKACRA
jgi:hydroxylysine kinase